MQYIRPLKCLADATPILFNSTGESLMAKKLYVGNLSYDVTETELTQLFSQCGQVLDAQIARDSKTQHSKGFGFIEMLNDDEARHAVDRMKGYELKGRSLTVDFSTDKPEGAVRANAPDFGKGRKGPPSGGGRGAGRR
jgi:cold-inducible RNA-binding protein